MNSVPPKITEEHIASLITDVAYYRFPGTTVTVCCLTLRNGFNAVGVSACVSPENFNQGIGERIAREEAINKVWPLEGYLMKELMHIAATNKLPQAEVVPMPPATLCYVEDPFMKQRRVTAGACEANYGRDRAPITGLTVTEGGEKVDTNPTAESSVGSSDSGSCDTSGSSPAGDYQI